MQGSRGNRTEVFWLTGRASWVPVAVPIDIERPDDAVLADVEELWNQVRHVPVGGRMTEESATLEDSSVRTTGRTAGATASPTRGRTPGR